MSIYDEKGLERWCVFCLGASAVFMVTLAVLALKATFGW